MTVFLSRRRRVYFLSEISASPAFIPKCRTDNSIFSPSTSKPSQYLNGDKYSNLTIILHKLSEHLSERTSVTHPAWRGQQKIKTQIMQQEVWIRLRLTRRGAGIIALSTVLRQDRLEKGKKKKKEQMSDSALLKKSKRTICWFLLVNGALTRLTCLMLFNQVLTCSGSEQNASTPIIFRLLYRFIFVPSLKGGGNGPFNDFMILSHTSARFYPLILSLFYSFFLRFYYSESLSFFLFDLFFELHYFYPNFHYAQRFITVFITVLQK